MALEAAHAAHEGVVLVEGPAGDAEPVAVALAVGEAERVGGLELAVGLLEGALVEERLEPARADQGMW